MQTLTIPLPDETAAQIDRLPDNERRAFLEKMQNFAAASLSGADEESEEEKLPSASPLAFRVAHRCVAGRLCRC